MLTKFYGTTEAVKGWKEILENLYHIECSEIQEELSPGNPQLVRKYFTAWLTTYQEEAIVENHWYATEEGAEFPWNMRIAFIK